MQFPVMSEERDEFHVCCNANGYHVIGNFHYAVATNLSDVSDTHTFTPEEWEDSPKLPSRMGAYNKAVSWTSPGA